MSGHVDETIRHEMNICQECGHDLSEVTGQLGRKKQVEDIPKPQIVVTAHQSISKDCPCCGQISSGNLPKHIK